MCHSERSEESPSFWRGGSLATLGMTALLLSGCGLRAPIRNTIVIEPDDTVRNATITVLTEFSTEATNRAVKERLRVARAAALDGRDEWSARFGNLTVQTERIFFEKQRGTLSRVERSAVVAIDDLQRFFADTGISVQITRGEGWSELALYPGASTRATRQQRERVNSSLKTWSADAVRYLRALHHLYWYLDREPQRAEPAFRALFSEETILNDEEESLVTEVDKATDTILEHMKLAESEATTLDEEFDLVYNPFPGEIVVKLPRQITAVEGFARRGADSAAISRAGLLDAAAALEGRWFSPDPLAILLRADDSKSDVPDAATLAKQPRRSTEVPSAGEVEKAFLEQLRPAATYRVRWSD